MAILPRSKLGTGIPVDPQRGLIDEVSKLLSRPFLYLDQETRSRLELLRMNASAALGQREESMTDEAKTKGEELAQFVMQSVGGDGSVVVPRENMRQIRKQAEGILFSLPEIGEVRKEVMSQLPLMQSSGERVLRRNAQKGDVGLDASAEELAYRAIEEISELMRAQMTEDLRLEMGDVMAYLAALARKLNVYG